MFAFNGVRTGIIHGLEVIPVSVEADISSGLPQWTIVGLPDAAVQEARERVRAALRNAELPFPRTRLTVNLAPASQRKVGTGFDLAIALAVLRAQKTIPQTAGNTIFLGELGLDGRIVGIRGVLPLLLGAPNDVSAAVVPVDNVAEATLQHRIHVLPAPTLRAVVDHVTGKEPLAPAPPADPRPGADGPVCDFADIRGQQQAKRALEIAAAGGHNLLLTGPPGTGKTLLARASAGIIPPLTHEELLEVVSLHSVAGTLSAARVRSCRPFRAPHHTSSVVAIVGGGHEPHPGDISLAHHGVLFLDELPEFPRSVLEALRQPLEEGFIQVSRAEGHYTFPARFLFIGARNPCPCGYAGSPIRQCQCAAGQILKYHKRISGPLLDRIDLHCAVQAIPVEELQRHEPAESSTLVGQRVAAARERQARRLGSARTNATMTLPELRRDCVLPGDAERLLNRAVRTLGLTARAYFRVHKVSRTIADLAGDERISASAVAEALQFRERSS